MRCEIGNLSLLLARIVAWYTYSAVKQAVAHGTSLRISSSLLRRYREIVRVSRPPDPVTPEQKAKAWTSKRASVRAIDRRANSEVRRTARDSCVSTPVELVCGAGAERERVPHEQRWTFWVIGAPCAGRRTESQRPDEDFVGGGDGEAEREESCWAGLTGGSAQKPPARRYFFFRALCVCFRLPSRAPVPRCVFLFGGVRSVARELRRPPAD